MKHQHNTNKMQYVSVLRVCSMLLIVLFHSMCFYTGNWWYLCTEVSLFWKVMASPVVKIGLTTFVFISGFLYGYLFLQKGKYRDVRSFVVNKCQRLLIPYFFWGIVMIMTMPEVQITWVNLFTGIAHLWFLLMLFEIFVIMILLNKMGIGEHSTLFVDFIIVFTSFVLLYVWKTYTSHHFVLAIEATLYYLPAFLVGFYYSKYRQGNENPVLAFLQFMIGVVLLFLFSFYNYPEESTLYRIPAIFVSISAMILLKNVDIPFCQSILFKNLDKNSMGIYIFNQIVVFGLLLNPEISLFLRNHSIMGGIILIFVVSLFVPWLLSNLFNRLGCLSFLIGSSCYKFHPSK